MSDNDVPGAGFPFPQDQDATAALQASWRVANERASYMPAQAAQQQHNAALLAPILTYIWSTREVDKLLMDEAE